MSDADVAKWKKRWDQARRDQEDAQRDHERRLGELQDELRRVAAQNAERQEAPSPRAPVLNLNQANLSNEASAAEIFASMKDILVNRCPERPYNGIKKALAAVADTPGKVTQ
ncbi:hypothetical protein P43SY_005107 [Pythium insidiosum]|uniref:Uncharacterized protein n=1 Tax=Pythium insidiosum TaxID=114742 RepID=A0AAD5M7B4_PYTIN|nr:hypothetical protein P43SY_005107 [Pythium insidiosum]